MVRAKIGGQGRAWDDQQVTAVYPSLTIRKNFNKILPDAMLGSKYDVR
jgi:hypothetical protein